MRKPYGVVDIFAGPGGLAEGFSRVEVGGNPAFKVELSIENEPSAYRTLRLRSFIHQFGTSTPQFYLDMLNDMFRDVPNDMPDARRIPDEEQIAESFPKEWKEANRIARCLTLSREKRVTVEGLLDPIIEEYKGRTVLIGGPPCQVYSLAGRSRNIGNPCYQGDDDHRHHLYREYIHILDYLRPAVFVMENVKGMLSSKLGGKPIFPLVRRDLEEIGRDGGAGYVLMTVGGLNRRGQKSYFTEPNHRDFVVRSEEYGVPQRRHRVIVIGVRQDIAQKLSSEEVRRGLLPERSGEVRLDDILGNMPKVRSGLSREEDTDASWREAVLDGFRLLQGLDLYPDFRTRLDQHLSRFRDESGALGRSASEPNDAKLKISDELRQWLISEGLECLPNHETRGHIREDLARYLFASIFAGLNERSPKSYDFPEALAPAHRNWKSGHFADRFRVQVQGEPSTTITSHISKDGHYFIHPDPVQCRSLTVREAARLQTFPDDYLFLGNRTQQYVQVGNAVPPYLAWQIATRVAQVLKR